MKYLLKNKFIIKKIEEQDFKNVCVVIIVIDSFLCETHGQTLPMAIEIKKEKEIQEQKREKYVLHGTFFVILSTKLTGGNIRLKKKEKSTMCRWGCHVYDGVRLIRIAN